MSQKHRRRVKSYDWESTFRSTLFTGLSLGNILALIISQLENLHRRPGIWIPLLAILHFSLVFFIEKSLIAKVWSRKKRLRVAFMVSAILPVFALWKCFSPAILGRVGIQASCDWRWTGLYLVVAFCAAFLSGLLVTNQYFPLWEDNLPPTDEYCRDVWHYHQKVELIAPYFPGRLMDACLAACGLVFSSPFWIFCLFLIWFEDPGPVLFVKNSVGKGGVNFKQLKLRTMVYNAEGGTGPVLSSEYDQRVLKSGRWFRKTALDELPQLVNILKGEMSFVGPRPQRTVLVHEYLQNLPEYAARHRVPPGLAGLAQVAGDYYLTPRQKLRFDNLYIKHRSLGFDLKLLVLAFLVAFWFRWLRDWDGRLPRRMLHSRSRRAHT